MNATMSFMRAGLTSRGRRGALVPFLFLACLLSWAHAAPKWTVMVYMLADNNLDCFGVLDLIEGMQGMYQEAAGCYDAECGAQCKNGESTTKLSACSVSQSRPRCCPTASYPDVLVLADRGVYACSFTQAGPYDYSLFKAGWTTAKEMLLLPGGTYQQLRDYSEINMASPDNLAAFLQRALGMFPPTSFPAGTDSRKYMLILWDHGNGWKGFGVDDQCSSASAYNPYGCDQFTIKKLEDGLARGLGGVTLDILGFDACLMSMYEVAAALRPYARSLLASEMLEPGLGWDYSALGDMVVGAASLTTEVAVATLWANKYKATAVANRAPPITLALADLRDAKFGALMTAMSNLCSVMSTKMNANANEAADILRARVYMEDMGDGDQDHSVDIGSMLTKLSTDTAIEADTRTAASAALAAYVATIRVYVSDGSIDEGTGMAIYFPMQKDYFDGVMVSDYKPFDTVTFPQLAHWANMLNTLFTKIATLTGAFDFNSDSLQQNNKPWVDTVTSSYVMTGTLSSSLGLLATAFYGFKESGSEIVYLLAGSQQGRVSGMTVTGSWRRYLWALSQAITLSDGSRLSRSSLMYATESWTQLSDGTAASVTLTAGVLYGASCSTPWDGLLEGLVRYTYVFATGASTLQLFVQQASGVLGEVNAQAAGVIIPRMYRLNTTTTETFQLAGCLKWGYNNVRMTARSIAFHADTYGLDLQEDMLMINYVRDLTFTKTATQVADFEWVPPRTKGGCQCKFRWTDASITVDGGCGNPDNDVNGPWCAIESRDSCTAPGSATGNLTDTEPWDYCAPQQTLSGCKCNNTWTQPSSGNIYHGRCDGGTWHPRGPSCIVDTASCPGGTLPAHGDTTVGDKWDYCQVQTVKGCNCANPWTANNATYHGTCATGFGTDPPPLGLASDSRWCQVLPGCATTMQYQGHNIDLCRPAQPRTTASGATACVWPQSYNGVPIENCITYTNSPAAESQTAYCFTAANNGSSAACDALPVCTRLDMHSCPTTAPTGGTSDFTPWQSEACLKQVCAANMLKGDSGVCASSPDDVTLATNTYNVLGASNAMRSYLASASVGYGSLPAYCEAKVGTDCVRELILNCPAVYTTPASSTAYNTAFFNPNATTAAICNTTCLTALCRAMRTTCYRSGVVEPIKLQLLQKMESLCLGTFKKLPLQMCSSLLAASVTCDTSSTLAEATGSVVLRSNPATGQYAPASSCAWRIQPPGMPYIQLDFTSFATEELYDTLTIEDGDGLVGVYSGYGAAKLPPSISTDTGLLKLNFTSDADVELSGFAGTYAASATRLLPLPVCANTRAKILLVTLKTRTYGNENSWALTRLRLVGGSKASYQQAGQTAIEYYGGVLPASVFIEFAMDASVPDPTNPSQTPPITKYRTGRSYVAYVCVPPSVPTLRMYDDYGDGWDGGSIAIDYVITAAKTYTLVNTTTRSLNSTTSFVLFVNMPESIAAYNASLARTRSGGTWQVRASFELASETNATFSATKQLVFRQAMAAVMGLDVKAVIIDKITEVATKRRALMDPLDAEFEPEAAAARKQQLSLEQQMRLARAEEIDAALPASKRPLLLQADPLLAAQRAGIVLPAAGGSDALGETQEEDQHVMMRRIALQAGHKLPELHMASSSSSDARVAVAAGAGAMRGRLMPQADVLAPGMQVHERAHALHSMPTWRLAAPKRVAGKALPNGGRVVDAPEVHAQRLAQAAPDAAKLRIVPHGADPLRYVTPAAAAADLYDSSSSSGQAMSTSTGAAGVKYAVAEQGAPSDASANAAAGGARRALLASTGLVMDVLLYGFADKASAQAAADQLSAAIKAGDLTAVLGDSGWITGNPVTMPKKPKVEDAENPNPKKKIDWKFIGIIVGASVGGLLVIALIAFAIYKWHKARQEAALPDKPSKKPWPMRSGGTSSDGTPRSNGWNANPAFTPDGQPRGGSPNLTNLAASHAPSENGSGATAAQQQQAAMYGQYAGPYAAGHYGDGGMGMGGYGGMDAYGNAGYGNAGYGAGGYGMDPYTAAYQQQAYAAAAYGGMGGGMGAAATATMGGGANGTAAGSDAVPTVAHTPAYGWGAAPSQRVAPSEYTELQSASHLQSVQSMPRSAGRKK